MSIAFRVLLIIAAVWAFLFVINEVRKAKLQISDSLPWFFFMAIFVILALFPQIAIFFASLLGIQSPVNLVFLFIIGILIIRTFKLTLRVSQLDTKIRELAQRSAIERTDDMVRFEKVEDRMRIDLFDASVFACVRYLNAKDKIERAKRWFDE